MSVYFSINPELADTLLSIFPRDIVGEILQHYYAPRHPLFTTVLRRDYPIDPRESRVDYFGYIIIRKYCHCGELVSIDIDKIDWYGTAHYCGEKDSRIYCFNMIQSIKRPGQIVFRQQTLAPHSEWDTDKEPVYYPY